MRVEINPQGLRATVLEGLNQCFPGWGDETRYRWFFEARRPFPEPDLLVARIDGGVAGALGVVYRRVSDGIGNERLAGILTGGWTLPAFRRRGVFGGLVSAAFEQLGRREGDLLLGFYRPGGSSASVLNALGLRDVHTYLGVFNDSADGMECKETLRIEPAASVLERLVQSEAAEERPGVARYLYRDADAARSQFIDRPDPVAVWRSDDGDVAIVATRGENHEVVKILPNRDRDPGSRFLRLLGAEAARRRGRLFLYTSDAGLADAARAAGFSITERLLGVAAPGSGAQPRSWSVCGGDRS